MSHRVNISVKLLATYRKRLPPGGRMGVCELQISPGTTVGEILRQFDIPLNENSVILVNGRTSEPNYVPEENDVIAAFPAMAGG